MSMQLVLQQIIVIFCYVAVGVGAGKLNIINPDQRKYLTQLCSGLILPFTILSAASMEIGGEGFRNLGIALGVAFLIMGGAMAGSLLLSRLFHGEEKFRAAVTSLISNPNCTFLGLPLCRALRTSDRPVLPRACSRGRTALRTLRRSRPSHGSRIFQSVRSRLRSRRSPFRPRELHFRTAP